MLKLKFFLLLNLLCLSSSRVLSKANSHPLEKTYNIPLQQKFEFRPSNLSPSYNREKIRKKLPLISAKPGNAIHTLEKEDGEPLYSVKYTLLEHLNRLVPASPKDNADNFLLLLGGSNTFGQWVSNENTLGNELQKILNRKNSKTRVHLLGSLGSSLAGLYTILKAVNIQEAFSEKKGTIIYNFFFFHMNRDNCLPPEVTISQGKSPRYTNRNGKLVYAGNCNDKNSVQWSLWLNKLVSPFSFILEYIPISRPSYEDFVKKEHAALTFDLLQAIEKLFRKNGKKIDIFVLNNNIYNPKNNDAFKHFKEKVHKSTYKFIPIKKGFLHKNEPKFTYEYDGHYNTQGYKSLAELIFKGLRKLNYSITTSTE